MNHFRYALLFIVFFAISFVCNSQTLTTVYNNTVSISPSYTINSGTTYTVTGEVKNVGTASISNNVHVNVAIDTSSIIGIKKYYWRATKTYSVTSFAPNSTFPFSVSDVATPPNGYKTTGNGVTIVVWTSIGILPNDSTTTLDSVFTTIYILPTPIGINEEINFETQDFKIQNPLYETLQITINNELYNSAELIDANGKCIQNILKNNFITPTNLTKGFYTLRIHNKKSNHYINKKIIIQ